MRFLACSDLMQNHLLNLLCSLIEKLFLLRSPFGDVSQPEQQAWTFCLHLQTIHLEDENEERQALSESPPCDEEVFSAKANHGKSPLLLGAVDGRCSLVLKLENSDELVLASEMLEGQEHHRWNRNINQQTTTHD